MSENTQQALIVCLLILASVVSFCVVGVICAINTSAEECAYMCKENGGRPASFIKGQCVCTGNVPVEATP